MSGHRCANNFTCPVVASTAESALNKFIFGKFILVDLILHNLTNVLSFGEKLELSIWLIRC